MPSTLDVSHMACQAGKKARICLPKCNSASPVCAVPQQPHIKRSQLQSAAQAQVLAPVEKGVPGRGPYRDALQCMLSVLMNLTHNNGPGCAAILWADGLHTVISLIDAVLGPPEEEAIFVRIADRQSPLASPLSANPQVSCTRCQYLWHGMHFKSL